MIRLPRDSTSSSTMIRLGVIMVLAFYSRIYNVLPLLYDKDDQTQRLVIQKIYLDDTGVSDFPVVPLFLDRVVVPSCLARVPDFSPRISRVCGQAIGEIDVINPYTPSDPNFMAMNRQLFEVDAIQVIEYQGERRNLFDATVGVLPP